MTFLHQVRIRALVEAEARRSLGYTSVSGSYLGQKSHKLFIISGDIYKNIIAWNFFKSCSKSKHELEVKPRQSEAAATPRIIKLRHFDKRSKNRCL